MRPEELFKQHDPGELVRKRYAPERDSLIGSLGDASIESEGAADHEAQIPAGAPPLLDQARELLARRKTTFPVERHHVGVGRDSLLERLPFLGHDPLHAGVGYAAFGKLHGLEAHVTTEQPLVVGDIVRKRVPYPADADENQAHECDTRPTMSDDNERERHINMHMSPETMAGSYANFANISHSDYEFTITFARLDHEVDEDDIPGVVVSRLNASPKFVRELIDALEDNYSKWSTREGIKNLPEYRGGSEGGEDQSRTSTS